MGLCSDGSQSFPAAKAIIGEIEYSRDDNILTPHGRATIITTAGGIYDLNCLQFTKHGPPTEENVIALWDTAPEHFTKRAF